MQSFHFQQAAPGSKNECNIKNLIVRNYFQVTMPRIIRCNEWVSKGLAETCAAENCVAAWLCGNFDAKLGMLR